MVLITLWKKYHVKYLGFILDDKINLKYHVSFISSKISRNIGIFYKLRHYLSPTQLRQIYYNLIFPHLSYAIIPWGSTYKSNIKMLQTKQNHIARVIVFLLYREKILKVLYRLNHPLIFDNCFKYTKDVHSYNTRYAVNDNLYKARFRTNTGKQTLSVMATNIWENCPPNKNKKKETCLTKRPKVIYC